MSYRIWSSINSCKALHIITGTLYIALPTKNFKLLLYVVYSYFVGVKTAREKSTLEFRRRGGQKTEHNDLLQNGQ
jgi:hypothetical protein